jgi:hypothetical protein
VREHLIKPSRLFGKPAALLVIGGIWLATSVFGTLLMVRYANSSGLPGSPPPSWPTASQLHHNQGQPTLLMFIHPQCPCSRASVGELESLMAHCQGRVQATVVFLNPSDLAPDWVHSWNWRKASRIPGVSLYTDLDGREARLFDAQTSGDAALYGSTGRLKFHGGITASRGHSGDNAGRDALQAIIFGMPIRQTNTPAFGCPLFKCPKNSSY